jgi:hypothetical protein
MFNLPQHKIRLLFLALLLGVMTSVHAQSAWIPRNPLPTGNRLSTVTWAGTQLVALGEIGSILTSPENVTSTFPRLPTQKRLSLRVTSSHLSATRPYSLNGQKTRAAIYTLTGGKIVEIRAGADREINIPIDNLARGRYVFELKGPGLRFAESFELGR